MSLTHITDRIKAEATQRIQQIEAEAEVRCERLVNESKVRIEEAKKNAASVTAKKIAGQHMAITSQAKQTGSLLQQKAKREVLDNIFAAVYAELEKMSGDEYVAFYTKHLQTAQLDTEAIVSVRVPVGRESESKQILESLNISAAVEVDSSLTAGMYFVSGAHSYDFSLATLFSDRRVDLEVMVVNELFSTT